MKKMIWLIAILTTIFLSLLSAVAIVNSAIAQNTTKIEKSSSSIEIEIFKNPYVKSSGWNLFKDFVEKEGIKIWALGYGTFNCIAFNEGASNCEFLEGTKDDDIWKVNIWLPSSYQQAQKNSYRYSFFDQGAETKMNSIICSFPTFALLLYVFAPDSLDKIRFNTKVPVETTGPHEMSSWSYFFTGQVTKGKNFEGKIMSPLNLDIDGDGENEICHYYEIRGRCGSIALKSPVGDNFTILKYLNYFKEWQKDPDFFT